jgi:Domain of unknown function (DUF4266)
MILRRCIKIALIVSSFYLAACSPIKPWVKPYERQNIVDEVMSFDRDPVANSYLHHVYDAREAARGGDGASGGGCGCN